MSLKKELTREYNLMKADPSYQVDQSVIDGYNSMRRTEALALPKEEVLMAIDIDEIYYATFGQYWNSNSHLSKLLDDPYLDKEDEIWANGMYLVIGNFIHKAFLEPEKAAIFPYSEATNRNQTLYKEDVAKAPNGWMFTKKDYDKWLQWVETMKNIPDVYNIIYDEGNEFEVPQIANFNGLPIKGKCDIINHEKKVIIDIKTTSDLDGFESKIDEWNYNVQAALYAKALYPDYDFRFLALDKKTDKAGVFDVSNASFKRGLTKLYRCTNLLKHFHLKDRYKTYYHYV